MQDSHVFKRISHSLLFDSLNNNFIIYGWAYKQGPTNDLILCSKGTIIMLDFSNITHIPIKELD